MTIFDNIYEAMYQRNSNNIKCIGVYVPYTAINVIDSMTNVTNAISKVIESNQTVNWTRQASAWCDIFFL